jgi:hypothetical protein
MRAVRAVAPLVGIVMATAATAAAQGQPAPNPSTSVPLRMQIAISRYQGDKRISATPFTFVVYATDPRSTPGGDVVSRVRMGVEVPITGGLFSSEVKPNAAPGPPAPTVQYRPFGTNIDCFAQPLESGRFRVSITIDESTPYSDEDKARFPSTTNESRASMNPVFRSFRLSNVLLLKDGQTEQMSSATDRFSGEVVKVDVTLSVIK